MKNVQTESSGEIRCHLAALSHQALFLLGVGGQGPMALCYWSHGELFHLLVYSAALPMRQFLLQQGAHTV